MPNMPTTVDDGVIADQDQQYIAAWRSNSRYRASKMQAYPRIKELDSTVLKILKTEKSKLGREEGARIRVKEGTLFCKSGVLGLVLVGYKCKLAASNTWKAKIGSVSVAQQKKLKMRSIFCSDGGFMTSFGLNQEICLAGN